MPWKETSTMDLRRCFIRDHFRKVLPLTELCCRYGISRPTGYKWICRFEAEGMEGLRDRSRRPHGCSHQVPEPIVEELIRDRKRHPTWGARKLLVRIARRAPRLASSSTQHRPRGSQTPWARPEAQEAAQASSSWTAHDTHG